jgi:sulfatase maturation enzyme AslB (radical SAM superfamily)
MTHAFLADFFLFFCSTSIWLLQKFADWQKILDFFLAERLPISIHPAVAPLATRDSPYSLSPQEYADLFRQILDYYIPRRREISISFVDQLCQPFVCGEGKVCTFPRLPGHVSRH